MSAKQIVVGIDASRPSLKAAALAWKIGRATGAACRLVHAVREPSGGFEYERASATARRSAAEARAASRKELLHTLRRVVPPAMASTLRVRPGRPARVLAERAARPGVALVVLGRQRSGQPATAFGRTTVHYLVRRLAVPLLVAATTAIKRVLVAVDLSATAAPTLRYAKALARRVDADLRVLHVVEPVRYPFLVPRALDRSVLQRRSVEAFHRLAAELGVLQSKRIVRRGSAAPAIAAAATRWRADLVVVGSQGKGFVDRLLIGSTTEWLLDHLKTASLLVVPPRR